MLKSQEYPFVYLDILTKATIQAQSYGNIFM